MSGPDNVVSFGEARDRADRQPSLTDAELMRIRAMLAQHEAIVSRTWCPIARSIIQDVKTIKEGRPMARRLLDPN